MHPGPAWPKLVASMLQGRAQDSLCSGLEFTPLLITCYSFEVLPACQLPAACARHAHQHLQAVLRGRGPYGCMHASMLHTPGSAPGWSGTVTSPKP